MSYRELGTGQVQSTDRPIIHFGSPPGASYPDTTPGEPVPEEVPIPTAEPKPRPKSRWRLFR